MHLHPRAGAPVSEQLAAFAFALVGVASIILAASHAEFWQRSHDTVPAAAVLLLLLLVALLRQHRWAWWVFVTLGVAGLVTWATDATREMTVGAVVGLLVALVQLGLLLSPPMRRYVRRDS